MKWRKKDDYPSKPGKYYVRLHDGFSNSTNVINFTLNRWEVRDEDNEVVEWLDEETRNQKEENEWKRIAVDALSGDENLVYKAYIDTYLRDLLPEMESVYQVLQLVEHRPCVETMEWIIKTARRFIKYKGHPVAPETLSNPSHTAEPLREALKKIWALKTPNNEEWIHEALDIVHKALSSPVNEQNVDNIKASIIAGIEVFLLGEWNNDGELNLKLLYDCIFNMLDKVNDTPVVKGSKELRDAASDFVESLCKQVYYQSEVAHTAAFKAFIAGAQYASSVQGWVKPALRFAEWCSWNFIRVQGLQDTWKARYGSEGREYKTNDLWELFKSGKTYEESTGPKF